MKGKRKIHLTLTAICLLCAVVIAFFTWQQVMYRYPPIAHIEIEQHSIHLLVGERMQLTVTGYTADGESVPQERIDKLDLVWEGSNPQSFEVSGDGLLLGLSNAHGSGNVQVKTKNGKLYSFPVTVTVYDWEAPVVVED